MAKVIVADTGPLIALALVDLLPVLPKLFSNVYVPEAVFAEATKDLTKPGAIKIKSALKNGWFITKSVEMTSVFQELIVVLDQGEAEALSLARQLDAVALIDEHRGRRVATWYGIAVTGSAAVLIKAKHAGFIGLVKPALEKWHKTGYRLSNRLVDEILKRVDE